MGHGYLNRSGGVTCWTKWADVQCDLSAACAAEKSARPHVPLVLLGESMGAKNASLAASSDPSIGALVTAGGLF